MKNATEQKKQKAIELMKKLEIYEPYNVCIYSLIEIQHINI